MNVLEVLMRRIIASLVLAAGLSMAMPEAMAGYAQHQVVSGGAAHSLTVRPDGFVYTYGKNSNGQLGRGALGAYSSTPASVPGISGAVSVAAGYGTSFVLTADGEVFAFGYGTQGQLGNGASADSNVPVLVSGLSHVIAISAGTDHALALGQDGKVYAWGSDNYGQLGNGAGQGSSNVPVEVVGLTDIVGIAAGSYHSLAVRADGAVFAFGSNGYGNLGLGNWTNQQAPVQIPGLSGIREVAAGNNHSLFRKFDGTVYGAGANFSGQLGDGTTTTRISPIQVPGISDAVSLATGSYHSMVLRANGSALAFGSNSNGQLCIGSTTSATVPTAVVSADLQARGQGSSAGAATSQLVDARGVLRGCGNNWSGQLGNGSMNAGPTTPTAAIAVW